jgi:hypothetical protein
VIALAADAGAKIKLKFAHIKGKHIIMFALFKIFVD